MPILHRLLAAALLATPASPLHAQCPAPEPVATLDPSLHETSGLAASRSRPGVLWTLVDSDGDPAVFAVDATGALLQRARVAGASNRDWEDLASGPCPSGTGDCLWIAETGDNLERYPEVILYVVPEPAPGDTVTAPARVFRGAYPEGPRDAEALFVTPAGRPYLISKGRNGRPVQLFAFPLVEDGTATLRPVQTLAERVGPQDGVTGAAMSADGAWVAVRTYTTFTLYRTRPAGADLRLEEAPGTRTPFIQRQGEAIAFGQDGIHLTSEVAPGERPPLVRTRCGPPRATDGPHGD